MTALQPYDPAAPCHRCDSEDVTPYYHERGIAYAAGQESSPWPCTALGWPRAQNLGPHMCCRCRSCGFSWARASRPEA